MHDSFKGAHAVRVAQRGSPDIRVRVCESDIFDEAILDRRYTPMQAAKFDQTASMTLFKARLAREISRQLHISITHVFVETEENRPRGVGPCGGECEKSQRCRAGERFECCKVVVGGGAATFCGVDRAEGLVRRAKLDAWWDVESWLSKKAKGATIVALSNAAIETLKGLTIQQLVYLFEENSAAAKRTPPTWGDMRAAILDELEARNEAAFVEWIWGNEDSPRKFFLTEELEEVAA